MCLILSWIVDSRIYELLKTIPYTTIQLRSIGIEILPLQPAFSWIRGVITLLLVPPVFYLVSHIITTYWLPQILPPPPVKRDTWQPLSLLVTLANAGRLVKMHEGELRYVGQTDVYRLPDKREIVGTKHNEKEANVTDLNWYVLMPDKMLSVTEPLPTIETAPTLPSTITFSI